MEFLDEFYESSLRDFNIYRDYSIVIFEQYQQQPRFDNKGDGRVYHGQIELRIDQIELAVFDCWTVVC